MFELRDACADTDSRGAEIGADCSIVSDLIPTQVRFALALTRVRERKCIPKDDDAWCSSLPLGTLRVSRNSIHQMYIAWTKIPPVAKRSLVWK